MSYEEALKKLRLDAKTRSSPIMYADEKAELGDAALAIMVRGKQGETRYQRSHSEELCDRLNEYLHILASPNKIRRTSGGLHQILADILGVLHAHESLWEKED